MKRSIFLISFLFISFYSLAQDVSRNSFTINGYIQGLTDTYIYFPWRGMDSNRFDSSKITNGKFKFSGKVLYPEWCEIYLKNRKGSFLFFLENADIHITGIADSMSDVKITGSHSQDDYVVYNNSIKDITDQLSGLNKKYSEAKRNKDYVAIGFLKGQMVDLNKEEDEKTQKFITSHPKSYVSLNRLLLITYSTPYTVLNKLFKGLDISIQNSEPGKELAYKLSIMGNSSVGMSALPFTQTDVNAKQVRLSDFKGKYVLLDFWASWCAPCRAENPNVLKAYNQFKDKGFTVLSVSMDDDAAKWKKVVVEDHLPWTQISDLRGEKNAVALEYGVKAIPANFLIDPNGIILARNLRGKYLEKKLSEVLR